MDDIFVKRAYIGEFNKFAAKLLEESLFNDGKYLTIIIQGKTGLGKTYLLQKMKEILEENLAFRNPGETNVEGFWRIEMFTAQQLIQKIYSFKTSSLYLRYAEYLSRINFLIIDDVDHFKSRKEFQKLLVHIIRERENRGKATYLSISSNSYEGFRKRLKRHLEKSVSASIEKPNKDDQVGIIKFLENGTDLSLDEEIAKCLANFHNNNVGELLGRVMQIKAYSELMNRKIDKSLVEQVMNEEKK